MQVTFCSLCIAPTLFGGGEEELKEAWRTNVKIFLKK